VGNAAGGGSVVFQQRFACQGAFAFQQPFASGDLQELLRRIVHLPGGLGVNAHALAGLHVEPALPGKLLGADQGEEVALGIVLKRRAGLLQRSVTSTRGAHQQIAAADQGGAERGFADAAAEAGFHQHLVKPIDLEALHAVLASDTTS
jgi:hypothetical protein